ncbi:cytochrome c oxidase assembly protein [Nitratireductor indicus]|uniref:Cytochrome c oxidase assembly protein CtaG n=1 Tax=Nitratireductor indicus C115 TaxID=1231190 RepID=K2NPP2_9HYPH|nr:cytochrome c oxidase assembly protein [Nitratireductor indicus]EKF41340.1 cytochrome C oxidase assembly protein [Nitratireductor indicus C115]MDS1138505.1 cytochrome c oxidase assembly protein [Nitratireductor indicus]SFQ72685.1 cytochrome c oxidase assembly protein subunit 11 [Nitratireductor indicus]
MSEEKTPQEIASSNRNRKAAVLCFALVGGMVGMAYAAVPLYQMFCQVTGYGGTTQRVEQYSDTILDQKITVRFDANVNGVPWEFKPVQREVTMRIGETEQISYLAHNVSDRVTAGTATFNVSPPQAGAYFNKVECFCFTEQELQPGQSYDMPVVFFVDPEIVKVPELKNLKTITLSYTFFPLEKKAPVAAAPNTNTSQNENLGG